MPASDWSELAQQVICWEPMTGRDAYAKQVFGPVQTFDPANDQGGRRVFKTVRKSSGTGAVDFISGSVIWILATPAIGLEDKIYVQGDTVFPPILNIERYPDETGAEIFVKVYLGSANG